MALRVIVSSAVNVPYKQARIREQVTSLREADCIPGLGVLIVGDRMDSHIYVARKVRLI